MTRWVTPGCNAHRFRKRQRSRNIQLWSSSTLVLAVSSLAAAQTAEVAPSSAPPAAPASTGPALQEVVVTARRRSENLERVPVAVTALSSAQLTTEGVRDQTDLQTSVPGLTVRQTENQNNFNYSIRGQSVDAFSNSQPAVVPYINDVQITGIGESSLYDLDNVQVLKGPQGTLFGRNATGGALLFNTAKPTNSFGGFATIRYGNYDLQEAQGAVNLPIVQDKVLLRVAGDATHQDGYQYNVLDDARQGATERESGRATLLLKPVAKLESTTTFEYDRAGGNNVAPVAYSANACGATQNGIALPDLATCAYGPGGPGTSAPYVAAHPGTSSGGYVGYVAQQRAMGPYRVYQDDPSTHDSHSYLITNSSTYDITPDLRVRNILGGGASFSRDRVDLDGSPYTIEQQIQPAGPAGGFFQIAQDSEEFQILGKALNHDLDYIVGVYYAYENYQAGTPLAAFNLTPLVPQTVPPPVHFKEEDTTEAVYFQGTYALGDLTGLKGLSATAGFRYTWDSNRITPLPGSQYAGSASEQADFSKPSWQVGVEYQVRPDTLLYVENRGSWRAGGFNGGATPILATAAGGGNLYLPETTYDVEVGAKFEGRVAGRPARLNLAFYDQWINNIQRVEYIFIGGNIRSVTANVPAAEVRGVEADGQLDLAGWLQLGSNAALTDARYTSPNVDLFSIVQTFGPYADTPKLSGTAYARVQLPAPASIGDLSLRGELYAQTSQYFSNQNNTLSPNTRLPGYGLLNFRFDWRHFVGTDATLSAFIKNATDKTYFVGGVAQGAVFGINTALPGLPRMYGLELRYDF